MVHTNCERNNAPAVWEVAAARCEAWNGSHKLGERNNALTLKMEKWKYGVILVMQLCCG
jgi:hypothetical protein